MIFKWGRSDKNIAHFFRLGWCEVTRFGHDEIYINFPKKIRRKRKRKTKSRIDFTKRAAWENEGNSQNRIRYGQVDKWPPRGLTLLPFAFIFYLYSILFLYRYTIGGLFWPEANIWFDGFSNFVLKYASFLRVSRIQVDQCWRLEIEIEKYFLWFFFGFTYS